MGHLLALLAIALGSVERCAKGTGMRVFWKPGPRGRASGLWARCESCGWSGPFEAFSIWDAKSGPLYICTAAECNTPLVQRALVASGYVLWAHAHAQEENR